MRVIEMECEGCGRLVRTDADGDACGACEIAMCASCLDGTARCPSCQAPFAASRGRVSVVSAAPRPKRRVPIAALSIAALALGFGYVAVSGEDGERARDASRPVRVVADALVARPRPGTAPCVAELAGARSVLDQAASHRFTPDSPFALGWELDALASAAHLEIHAAEGVAPPFTTPITGALDRHTIALVIDRWEGARVDGDRAVGGELEGYLVVWDHLGNGPVCAADLDVRLPPQPASTEGDASLARAASLVVAAFVRGLADARATELAD